MAKETFGSWLLRQAKELAGTPGGGAEDQLVHLAALAWKADEGRGKIRSVEGVAKRMSTQPGWEALEPALNAAVARFTAGGQIPPEAGNAPEPELPGEPMDPIVLPPVHPYAGSNPARQGAGSPGHCGMCMTEGHLVAHPNAGCADVGCTVVHGGGESPPDENGERSGDGRGELQEYQASLAGAVSGPGKSPLAPVLAAEAQAFVTDAKVHGEALEALALMNRWREFMAGPADEDSDDDALPAAGPATAEAARLLAIAGQALLDAAAALAPAAAGRAGSLRCG